MLKKMGRGPAIRKTNHVKACQLLEKIPPITLMLGRCQFACSHHTSSFNLVHQSGISKGILSNGESKQVHPPTCWMLNMRPLQGTLPFLVLKRTPVQRYPDQKDFPHPALEQPTSFKHHAVKSSSKSAPRPKGLGPRVGTAWRWGHEAAI